MSSPLDFGIFDGGSADKNLKIAWILWGDGGYTGILTNNNQYIRIHIYIIFIILQYIYIAVYVHIAVCVYISILLYIYIHIAVYIYTAIWIYIYAVYIGRYKHINIHIYIYINVHIGYDHIPFRKALLITQYNGMTLQVLNSAQVKDTCWQLEHVLHGFSTNPHMDWSTAELTSYRFLSLLVSHLEAEDVHGGWFVQFCFLSTLDYL